MASGAIGGDEEVDGLESSGGALSASTLSRSGRHRTSVTSNHSSNGGGGGGDGDGIAKFPARVMSFKSKKAVSRSSGLDQSFW